MKRTHIDLFDDNNWGWTLNDATISGGVLDITVNFGNGRRYPNANWYSGVNNDFTVEVDFKQDSTPANDTMYLNIGLVGNEDTLMFNIIGASNLMEIYWGMSRVSQAFVDDTSWHTAKVRRVGAMFYFSIDGGAEISWNCGAEAIQFIQLRMYGCTGDFDNFKYSYIELGKGTGVGNPLIL